MTQHRTTLRIVPFSIWVLNPNDQMTFILVLSCVAIPSVTVLRVVMLSVIRPIVIMLSVIVLNPVAVLRVMMLSVVMLLVLLC